MQRRAAAGALRRGAVLRPGAAGHRHRPRLRPHHLRHRRGDGRLRRGQLPLLRHAQGAPGPARPGRRARRASSPTRSPPTPPTWPAAAPAPATATTSCRGPATTSTGSSSSPSRWTRRRPGACTTRRWAHDVFKHAEFCSMCGPKFCSMQISRHLGEERPEAHPRRRAEAGRAAADNQEQVDGRRLTGDRRQTVPLPPVRGHRQVPQHGGDAGRLRGLGRGDGHRGHPPPEPGQPQREDPAGLHRLEPLHHPPQHRRLPHGGGGAVHRPPGPRGHRLRLDEAGGHPRPQVPAARPHRHAGGGAAPSSTKGSPSCPTSTPTPSWPASLQEMGCATVMPLGSPIGSGRGIFTLEEIQIIIENAQVPVVVDAGLAVPSDASLVMEVGADAVLVNTAIAQAQDPALMAEGFRLGVEAGRKAYLAGRIPKKAYASACSPLEGVARAHLPDDTVGKLTSPAWRSSPTVASAANLSLEEAVAQAIEGRRQPGAASREGSARGRAAGPGRELRDVTRGRALFVVNDRLDVALACRRRRRPPAGEGPARGRGPLALAGEAFIIGRSVHSVAEAVRAQAGGRRLRAGGLDLRQPLASRPDARRPGPAGGGGRGGHHPRPGGGRRHRRQRGRGDAGRRQRRRRHLGHPGRALARARRPATSPQAMAAVASEGESHDRPHGERRAAGAGRADRPHRLPREPGRRPPLRGRGPQRRRPPPRGVARDHPPGRRRAGGRAHGGGRRSSQDEKGAVSHGRPASLARLWRRNSGRYPDPGQRRLGGGAGRAGGADRVRDGDLRVRRAVHADAVRSLWAT